MIKRWYKALNWNSYLFLGALARPSFAIIYQKQVLKMRLVV